MAPESARGRTASAPLGSPSRMICARGSSSRSPWSSRVVAQRGVDQHGVVRVLRGGREARSSRSSTQWTSACAVGEQLADQAAVGLVGCDEEEDEGRVGHGAGADRMAASIPEQ